MHYMEHRGRLIAEMDLFVRACPLKRGRAKTSKSIYQPIDNQREMLNAMAKYSGLMISDPCLVEVSCGYKKWNAHSRVTRFDVDNVLKALLDDLVKTFILADDHFVVGASVVKLPAKEDFTTIKIFESELCYRLGLIKQKQLDQP